MKHLKRFNESVNNEVIQNIKDILIDLEDEGFITNVYHINNSDINVSISKPSSNGSLPIIEFYTHLKDYIIRLIDYTESESYQYFFRYSDSYKYTLYDIDEFEKLIKSGYLDNIKFIDMKFTLKR